MPRYKLTIEYYGTGLVGWQRQPIGLSVQGIIETAFERFIGQRSYIQGAGRTDAGVHATCQVAHVDLDRDYDVEEIRGALNYHVKPNAVAILKVERGEPGFHARISATHRAYLYRILNRRAPAALDLGRVWHVGNKLDVEAMAAGATYLVGHHDFTTFRAKDCQANTAEKTMDRLEVARNGDEIHIIAEARSFLYHQVRNIVGTLKLVGTGQWTPEDVSIALAARHRGAGGPTAPPEGLYLTAVGYEPLRQQPD